MDTIMIYIYIYITYYIQYVMIYYIVIYYMYKILRRQQNTRLLQLETPGHHCGEPSSNNDMVMRFGTPTIATLQHIINPY